MTTEKFTVEQFADAIGCENTHFEWENGQYVARRYVGKYIVKIYSTISQDGTARDTGDDSIRVVLLKDSGYGEKPAISKEIIKSLFGAHYITRVKGWSERLATRIEQLQTIATLAGECDQCGAKSIFKVKKPGKNRGRLFANCSNRSHNAFKWIEFNGKQNNNTSSPSEQPKQKTNLMQSLDKAEGVPEKKVIVWSDYQLAVYDFIRESSKNIVVDAVAGSGKTTTLERSIEVCLEQYGNSVTVMFCAFNVHIVDALRAKAGHLGVRISTLHSKGLSDIRKVLKVSINEYKVHNIFDNLVGHKKYQRYDPGDTIMNHKPGVVQVVGLLKMLMLDPTEQNVDLIVDSYGIDIGDEQYDYDYIVGLAIQAYNISIADKHVVDFNDMPFYPAMGLHSIVPEQFDIVLIDELQDLNKCQRILVLKTYKMRIIGVGDENQSIYRFAGADKSAFQAFISETDAEVLPLSITYRCSQLVTQEAQRYVPHIQWAENAALGEISTIEHHQLVGVAEEGDIVECRVNAPLIPLAYEFIRNGKKAVVLGRDIGKGLIALIDRMVRTYDVDNISELSDALIEYERVRSNKLLAQGKKAQAEVLGDKVECILAMIVSCGAENIFQLKDEIDNLFYKDRAGVTLTSIHKIKGQEPDGDGTVFLLHPERLFPDWGDPQEEKNIAYVAKTRAKKKLVYVLRE